MGFFLWFQLLIDNINKPAPNITHLLLKFDVDGPVERTLLQPKFHYRLILIYSAIFSFYCVLYILLTCTSNPYGIIFCNFLSAIAVWRSFSIFWITCWSLMWMRRFMNLVFRFECPCITSKLTAYDLLMCNHVVVRLCAHIQYSLQLLHELCVSPLTSIAVMDLLCTKKYKFFVKVYFVHHKILKPFLSPRWACFNYYLVDSDYFFFIQHLNSLGVAPLPSRNDSQALRISSLHQVFFGQLNPVKYKHC